MALGGLGGLGSLDIEAKENREAGNPPARGGVRVRCVLQQVGSDVQQTVQQGRVRRVDDSEMEPPSRRKPFASCRDADGVCRHHHRIF